MKTDVVQIIVFREGGTSFLRMTTKHQDASRETIPLNELLSEAAESIKRLGEDGDDVQG